MNDKKNSIYWLIAVVGVTVLGAALRVHRIGVESMWVDEGLFMNTIKLVREPWKLMSTNYVSDAPLFYFIAATWQKGVRFLTDAPYASEAFDTYMRLLPASIGIATIPFTYVLGVKLTGHKAPALFAAFFCAISPFQVYYAQELRPYTFHVLLCIISALAMILALEKNRWQNWLLLSLCMIAGIYNHFFMVFCIMAMNVWFLITIKVHMAQLKPWVITNLVVILASIPGIRLAMSIQSTFEAGDETWYPAPSLKLGLITFKNFFAGYTAHVPAYQIITVLAGMLCLLGVYALRQQKTKAAALVALAATPILVGIAYWSTTNFPYYTHRLMIFSAIPCYLLAGHGILVIKAQWMRGILVGAITLLSVPALGDFYEENLHPTPAHTVGVLYKIQNREAAEFIRDRRTMELAVLHRVRNTYWPQRYYTGNRNFIVDINGAGIQDAMKAYPDEELFVTAGALPSLIDEKTPEEIRFFYIQSWWQPYNMDAVSLALAQHLDNRFLRIDQQRFDGQTVYVYEPDGDDVDYSRRAQVADAGNVTYIDYPVIDPMHGMQIKAYRKKHPPEPPQYGQRMTSSFWATLYPIDEEYALPQHTESGDQITFSYYVHNDETPRDLEVSVYQGSKLIEPMALKLTNPMEGTWYPEYQFEPIAPELPSNVLAWTAKLESVDAEQHAIQGTYHLPAGSYRVMANIRYVTDPASLRFTVENETGQLMERDVMVPVSLSGMGWRWTAVGSFEVGDEPFDIKVTTHPGIEPEHHRVASIGRIVLFPSEVSADQSPFRPVKQTVSLKPNESRKETMTLKRLPGEGQHIMVDIKESDTNQHRNLYFYVPNPDWNEGENE
jgi:hypothetical protein